MWGRIATFAINRRPYKVPLFCPTCGTEHRVKTYHIAIGSDGIAYVSTTIWEAMQRYNGTGGFELAEETRGKPPTQLIGMASRNGHAPDVARLEEFLNG